MPGPRQALSERQSFPPLPYPSELFWLFLSSGLRPESALVPSAGSDYVQVQDLAASLETELGLLVPGPSVQKLLGAKEQRPLLPCALAWRLRAARRSQVTGCCVWAQCPPKHT